MNGVITLFGYDIKTFLSAGFSLRDIIQSASDSSAADLAQFLRRVGVHLEGLEHCSAQELAEAGCSAKFVQWRLYADHTTPIKLLRKYNKEELERLKGLGYMPENLPAVSVSELRGAGYTAKECLKQGRGTMEVLCAFGVQGLPALMTCLCL